MAKKVRERQIVEMKSLFFFACAIKEGRRRRLQTQLALSNLGLPSIIADFPKEHHSSSSGLFLSSAEKKYWLVGECLQYLFRCRVSRKTFNFILNRIAPLLVWQTVTEEPIMPALRLAICLYRLGRGDYFYTISEMSGLGIYTVSSICQEVRQVLVDHLWNETVSTHMPQKEEEFKQKIPYMEEFGQFPCC